MVEVSSMCPSCELEAPCVFVERWMDFTLFKCVRCDLVFSSPSVIDPVFYESHPDYAQLERDVPLAWYHKVFCGKRFNGKKTLLDVGCATGNFLNKCRGRYSVEGMDFNRSLIEYGKREYGLALSAVSPQEYCLKKRGCFDIITCFETLEHQSDPAGFLRGISLMLERDGVLVLTVPNRPISSRLLPKEMDSPPHHFLRWNARSLRQFLRRNGFSAKIQTHHFGNWVFTFERIVALALPSARNSYRSVDVRGFSLKRLILRACRRLFIVPALLTYPIFWLFPTGGIQLFVIARRVKE